MKKLIIGILISCILMILMIIYKIDQKTKPLQVNLNLSFNTLNGDIYNTDGLDKKPTLVFFLQPKCDDCEVQAKFINTNRDFLLKKYNVIAICCSDFQEAYHFFKTYHFFIENTKIIIGFDSENEIILKYNILTTPTCLLFDSKGNQKKRIESLVTSLSKIELNFN